MKKTFILGYNAINLFNDWFKINNYKNTDFYFIDNGRQNLPNEIKNMLLYTTSRNIGCAGGWNLICDIAFKHMGLEKVIIGEEDAIFNQEMLESVWEYCTPDRIMTTYGNGFGYALFCIHKKTFEKIGRFDENIMYAACEDADHKIRCSKGGVEVFCMEADPSLNDHSTAWDPSSPRLGIHEHNLNYLRLKWGADFHINSVYYDKPFNGNPPFIFDPTLEEHYGKLTEFPSETEYKLYKNSI